MIQQPKITVLAPARLHMGFIDLSNSLGRQFGSIGLTINEYATHLSLSPAKKQLITGMSDVRAKKALSGLCKAFDISDKLEIQIHSAIPEHIGLGSGTQMTLAIGAALNALYDLKLTVREIAATLDRGLRSGIGIGGFEQGGLIVDGGRGENSVTPPVIARMNIPDSWRFILVFDQRGQGLHGNMEIEAFKRLPPFPEQEAMRLCYLLLLQALPAVAENRLSLFGAVITQLQNAVGSHFAPVQGGIFTSNEVAVAMSWLAEQGAVAIGQTSWGPTGFCAIDGIDSARSLCQQAAKNFAHLVNLSFVVVSARNTGAEVFADN